MTNSFFTQKAKKEQSKEQKRIERRARWLPFQKYWLLYLGLAGTAILSAFAGLYIGVKPDPSGMINFTSAFDGIRRIFFAIFYMAGFIANAEGATLYWETKLIYHDVNEKGESNETQLKVSKIALGISIGAVLVTGLSAAYFLAAWLGSLENIQSVPIEAQTWAVWSIPILFIYHVASSVLYWYNSAEAELERWQDQVRRQTKAQMSEIEAQTWKDEYTRIAPELARQRGLALAGKAAQEDFYQREMETGKDLDGDGVVGRPANTSQRTPTIRPRLVVDPPSHPYETPSGHISNDPLAESLPTAPEEVPTEPPTPDF